MKVFSVWLLAGATLLGLSGQYISPRQTVAAPLSAIVHITSIDDDGEEIIHCSGFAVSQIGLFVTARHCVGLDEPIAVDAMPAHLVNYTETLALVATDISEPRVFTIREDAPSIGSVVIDYGYVGAYGLVTLTHHVAGFHTLSILHQLTFLDEATDVVLDAPLINGMSGGPSIDEQGYVVGVNEASNENNSVLCGVAEIHALMPR